MWGGNDALYPKHCNRFTFDIIKGAYGDSPILHTYEVPGRGHTTLKSDFSNLRMFVNYYKEKDNRSFVQVEDEENVELKFDQGEHEFI
jgi:hypothetical protein